MLSSAQAQTAPFHFITCPAAQVSGITASAWRFMKAAICLRVTKSSGQ
jgi:hypothetical protein